MNAHQPRNPCPKCGSETSLVAGIVLYEHRHRGAYEHRFDVCWADSIHRRRGSAEWHPIGNLVVPEADAVIWTEHTYFHWSMRLHGEQLHYWPSKRRIGWRNITRQGFDKRAALALAKRIAKDAGARI